MNMQIKGSFRVNECKDMENSKEERLNSYLVMDTPEFVHNLLYSRDKYKYNQKIIDSYNTILDSIKRCWTNLSMYKNPTKEMCLIALEQNPFAIQYIDSNSDIYQEMCDVALDSSFRVIKAIENPTFLQCVKAIDKNVCAVRYINNITQDVKNYAITKDPSVIKYFVNLTFDECKLALSLDGLVLEYIKSQYQYKVHNFIDQYGFVNTKREIVLSDLCYIAVNQNPEAIQFVINQTEDICKKAVSKDGMCLRFVNNKTKEICDIAVKQNPNASMYVY